MCNYVTYCIPDVFIIILVNNAHYNLNLCVHNKKCVYVDLTKGEKPSTDNIFIEKKDKARAYFVKLTIFKFNGKISERKIV